MKRMKSYLIDFAEGRVSVPEFLEHCGKHPEVLDFLTCIADSKFKTCIVHRNVDEKGFPHYVSEELPFDAKLFLNEEMKTSSGVLGKYLNIHSLFSNVLVTAFSDEEIVVDKTLSNKYSFMLDACPEYIGGSAVEGLLESLLELLPDGLSKTQKMKLYKEKVKMMFHVAPNKYPRWIQEAEWPLGKNNIPMRFVTQTPKKGKAYETIKHTDFLFEDVTTGEQCIVEQFM